MPEDARAGQPSILLIDDDEFTRRLVAVTLRGAPVRVLQASTAVEGLRLARDERPLLVLLDIGLGREDGVRLCAALKAAKETRAIHVVMLSAHDDPETRVRAHRAGADGFLGKPFSPLALWRTVDDLTA